MLNIIFLIKLQQRAKILLKVIRVHRIVIIALIRIAQKEHFYVILESNIKICLNYESYISFDYK